MRLSLGATRARVVRQLLVEAGAIALVACGDDARLDADAAAAALRPGRAHVDGRGNAPRPLAATPRPRRVRGVRRRGPPGAADNCKTSPRGAATNVRKEVVMSLMIRIRRHERGLRFRRAYATAPETLPSHASIFTGG